MLYQARRFDLVKMLREYGKTRGNILHCYSDPEIGKSTNTNKRTLGKTERGNKKWTDNIGHKLQNKTNKTKTQHRKIKR